jgi:xanthine dehydrogenase YagS FAD-binding subunit
MADVAWHPLIRDRLPLVSQSLLLAASGQLRNMATIGGNVLQRTRCPYFRDTATPCNKRVPGSGCSAIRGYNRMLAILGGSDHCIATHASDLAVALAALAATVNVRSPGGSTRSIAFGDFHILPDAHPEMETSLRPGELITSIDVPALPFSKRSLYLKVRDRASYAFALSSAAVALDVQDGVVRDARIALGGVATKPWRSEAAERTIVNKRVGAETFREAAEAALAGARAQTENGFKIELAKRTLVRALSQVSA